MSATVTAPSYKASTMSGAHWINSQTTSKGPPLNMPCNSMDAPMPRFTRSQPSTMPVSHWGSTSSGNSHQGVPCSVKLYKCTAANSKDATRSEEHTYELQSLMRISYAVFFLKKKKHKHLQDNITYPPRTPPTQ